LLCVNREALPEFNMPRRTVRRTSRQFSGYPDKTLYNAIISCIIPASFLAFFCDPLLSAARRASQKYHVHLNGLIHRGRRQPLGPMSSQGPSSDRVPSLCGATIPSPFRYPISFSRYTPCLCLQHTSVQTGQVVTVYSSMSGDESIRSCLSFNATSICLSVMIGCEEHYLRKGATL